mmetsp:Transcript_23335/g.59815  ORF Transcript_23335/g.59815 Transcript_23335/m.59815 type:complete len:341 (+) Transcript_23335:464-1486(+)
MNGVDQRGVHQDIDNLDLVSRDRLAGCHLGLNLGAVHGGGCLQANCHVADDIHPEDVGDLERRREQQVVEGHGRRPDLEAHHPEADHIVLCLLRRIGNGAALEQRHHKGVQRVEAQAPDGAVQEQQLQKVQPLAAGEGLVQSAVEDAEKGALDGEAVDHGAQQRLAGQLRLAHDDQLDDALRQGHAEGGHHAGGEHGELLGHKPVRRPHLAEQGREVLHQPGEEAAEVIVATPTPPAAVATPATSSEASSTHATSTATIAEGDISRRDPTNVVGWEGARRLHTGSAIHAGRQRVAARAAHQARAATKGGSLGRRGNRAGATAQPKASHENRLGSGRCKCA